MVGFAKAFDQTDMAQRTRGTLAQPYEAPNPKCEEALIQYKYALSGELLLLTVLHGMAMQHQAISLLVGSCLLAGSYSTLCHLVGLHFHFHVMPAFTEKYLCAHAESLLLNLPSQSCVRLCEPSVECYSLVVAAWTHIYNAALFATLAWYTIC